MGAAPVSPVASQVDPYGTQNPYANVYGMAPTPQLSAPSPQINIAQPFGSHQPLASPGHGDSAAISKLQ